MKSIEAFNTKNDNSIAGFEYEAIEPIVDTRGLYTLKIYGKKFPRSQFEKVSDRYVHGIVKTLYDKYGQSVYKDSIGQSLVNNETRVATWKEGDKLIALDFSSDEKQFMYTIKIMPEKRIKQNADSIVHNRSNPI